MSMAELLSLVDRVQQERSMSGRDPTEDPLDLAGVQALASYLTTRLALVDGNLGDEGLRPEDVQFFLLPALAGFAVAVVLLWPRRLGDSSLGLTAEEFPATKPDPNLSDDPYPGRPRPSPPDLGEPRERVADPTDCAEGEESQVEGPRSYEWAKFGCIPRCYVDPATGLETGTCEARCPPGVARKTCQSGASFTNFAYTIPFVGESACQSLHCGLVDLQGVGQDDCILFMEGTTAYEDRVCTPRPSGDGDCHIVEGGCICVVEDCYWDVYNWTGAQCTYEEGVEHAWSLPTPPPDPLDTGETVEQWCHGQDQVS